MTALPGNALPLFPLPEVVLLPGTVLPLQVFEPRYVSLVEDLQRSGGRLAVPHLRLGETTPRGAPAFDLFAGAGVLQRCETLPAGRYLIEIRCQVRVRLEEIAVDTPYRQARATEHPEDLTWLAGEEGERSASGFLRLVRPAVKGTPAVLPDDAAERAAMLNRVATQVISDAVERQAYLEADDYRVRIDMLLHQLRIMKNTALALARLGPPLNPENN